MKKQILILAALILSGCSSEPPRSAEAESLKSCQRIKSGQKEIIKDLKESLDSLRFERMFTGPSCPRQIGNNWEEAISAMNTCLDLGGCLGKKAKLTYDGELYNPYCEVGGEKFQANDSDEMELALKICRSRR